MFDTITNSLKNLEQQENIRILYACESGSRGWGFASEDSDYDVRFIYIHTPEWYLSVNNKADVITFFSDDRVFDLSGWDIRKALMHFHGSNPTLYDWLQSPIIYDQKLNFRESLLALAPTHYSLRRGTHHYLGIMMNTFNEEMTKEQVRLKKIFYVLRTALSALWMVRKGEVPPMQFAPLRTLVEDAAMQLLIAELLEKKLQSTESDAVPRNDELNAYVLTIRDECEEAAKTLEHTPPDLEIMNELFRTTLREIWQ